VGDPLPELSGDATFPKSASYYEDANEDPWDDAPDSDADVLSDILAGREVVVEGRDEFIDDGPQAQCDEPEVPQPPELPQPEWRFRPLAAAGSSDDAPSPSLPPPGFQPGLRGAAKSGQQEQKEHEKREKAMKRLQEHMQKGLIDVVVSYKTAELSCRVNLLAQPIKQTAGDTLSKFIRAAVESRLQGIVEDSNMSFFLHEGGAAVKDSTTLEELVSDFSSLRSNIKFLPLNAGHAPSATPTFVESVQSYLEAAPQRNPEEFLIRCQDLHYKQMRFNINVHRDHSILHVKQSIADWITAHPDIVLETRSPTDLGEHIEAITDTASMLIIYKERIWEDYHSVMNVGIEPEGILTFGVNNKQSVVIYIEPDHNFEIETFRVLCPRPRHLDVGELYFSVRAAIAASAPGGARYGVNDFLLHSVDKGVLLKKPGKYNMMDKERIRMIITKITVRFEMYGRGDDVKDLAVRQDCPVAVMKKMMMKQFNMQDNSVRVYMSKTFNEVLQEPDYVFMYDVLDKTLVLRSGLGGGGKRAGSRQAAGNTGKAKDRKQRLLLLADEAQTAALEMKEPKTPELKPFYNKIKEMMGLKADGSFDEAVPQNYLKQEIENSTDLSFLKRVASELEAVPYKDVGYFHKAVIISLVENYKNMEMSWEEFDNLKKTQLAVMSYVYACMAMVSDNGNHDNTVMKTLVSNRRKEIETAMKEEADRAELRRQADAYVQQQIALMNQQQPQGHDQMQT
jgi:hypothetical protein